MLYAIISEDAPDSLDKRQTARPAPSHVKRLQELQDAGRLVLAGPHPAIDGDNPGSAGFTGSLIVAEFESLQDAQQWADTDPYTHAKVYSKVTVKPFKKVFPQ